MTQTNTKYFIPTAIPPCIRWLFPYKIKPSLPKRTPLLYYIFQNKISILAINWLLQGMRGMGKTDLLGKVVLELILTSAFFIAVEGTFLLKIGLSLFIAHTLNWLINAHFWDTGRFLGITRTNPNRFLPYVKKIKDRSEDSQAIDSIIIIGGTSRGQGIKETSDIDMLFIKKGGIVNTINAELISIRERAIAFFLRFPLHLELYDSITMMGKHCNDEIPFVLKDASGNAKAYYKKQDRMTAQFDDYEKEAQGLS